MGATCGKESGSAVVVRTGGEGSAAPLDLFSQLDDDVVLCILSYVCFSPFEKDTSNTMTLSSMSSRDAVGEEIKRLLADYNRGSAKLNTALYPQNSVSPFQAPWHFYQGAFHLFPGVNTSLPRVSSFKTFGTLTHVLPLVNKRLHGLCTESNALWTEAFERLLGFKDDDHSRSDLGSSLLWEKGLISLVDSNEDLEKEGIGQSDANLELTRKLIANACDRMEDQNKRKDSNEEERPSVVKEVVRQVALHHKPLRLPVFTMRHDVTIGQEVILRLFEPRYRLLIADTMAGRTDNERMGFPLSVPRPRFLFACKAGGWRQRVACIADIRRCDLRPEGIADVSIVPIKWVLMEDVSIRPESSGLLDATVFKKSKKTIHPVFCMRCRLVLGQSIQLHFFENRYKILITEIMEGRTDSERNNGAMSLPLPQFVFACQTPLKSGNAACLVEVVQCLVRYNGTVDLTVVPRSWVLIDALSMRANSGKLFDATVLHPMIDMVSFHPQ